MELDALFARVSQLIGIMGDVYPYREPSDATMDTTVEASAMSIMHCVRQILRTLRKRTSIVGASTPLGMFSGVMCGLLYLMHVFGVSLSDVLHRSVQDLEGMQLQKDLELKMLSQQKEGSGASWCN